MAKEKKSKRETGKMKLPINDQQSIGAKPDPSPLKRARTQAGAATSISWQGRDPRTRVAGAVTSFSRAGAATSAYVAEAVTSAYRGGAATSGSQDTEEKAMEDPVRQGDKKLTPELKRKMERKLKKERKKEERRLLRESGIPVIKKKPQKPQKPSACDLALKYLTKWSNKHEEWKFQKTRQKWLLQHMYDCDKMSDVHFTLLLGYLEGLKGKARDVTIQKTEALIKECDTTDDPTVVSAEKIERMRQVLQLLS